MESKRQINWKNDLLVRSREDPVWWIENVLGQKLWSKQKEICYSIRDTERVAVPASFGVGKCMGYSEDVILANGSKIPAWKLIGKEFEVLAFDPSISDQIPAKAIAADNGFKDVFKITTKSGRTIIRTENHPLYACEVEKHNTTLYPENVGFKDLTSLDISKHAVAVPIKLDIDNPDYPISDDEIKLLGYLLGDGGLTLGVAFTQLESKTKDEFREIVKRMGCECVDRDSISLMVVGKAGIKGGSKDSPNIVLEKVRSWGIWGKKAVDKEFPEFVWRFSDRQLALLLNRLWSCDGWASINESAAYANPQIGITFASEQLTNDVFHALIRLGIHFYKSSSTTVKGTKVFYAYTCSTRKAIEVIKFKDIVGIYGKEEQLERVYNWSISKKHLKTNSPQWIYRNLPEGYMWEKIKSIEYVGYQKTVAISVPVYNTYLTEFVEHNTFISACLALWFLYNFKPAKVISTAPTFRQVRDLLWSEIRNMHNRSLMPLGGECLQLSLKLNDEQFAIGFSTDANNIDMFTGYHSPNQLVIFDQAAGLPPMFWEAAEGLMTSANCRWLAISNTAISDSEFANICLPDRKSRFGNWKVIKIAASQSPNVVAKKNIYPGLISYDWVEKRKKVWGPDDPLYKIFIEAEFVLSAQMVVIPERFLRPAYDHEGIESDEIEIGVDVARSGLDSTVMFARSGSSALHIKRYTGNDTMEVTGHVIEFMRWLEDTYKKPVTNVKIDVIGVGAGVYDRLVELNQPCTPVNNSESKSVVDQERYANIRAEMAWALRKRFENYEIGLKRVLEEDEEIGDYLKGDLLVQKYKITSTGKIQLWSKDDIKKELGRSPDYYDACVMAFESPGGGVPSVEFVNPNRVDEKDDKLMSEDEWLEFLGLQVDVNSDLFR